MESAANNSIHVSPGVGRREELTRLAEKWVSQTFFGTLLKQMRNSAFRSELFDGGRGGQAFGALYDQQLGDRMSRGAGQKLVRSIVRQLEGRQAYEETFNVQRPTLNVQS